MVEARANSRVRESVMTAKRPIRKLSKRPRPKRKLDDELNEALEETFPASDPVKLTQPDPHPEPDPENSRRPDPIGTWAVPGR
jgi:hypothetical protein